MANYIYCIQASRTEPKASCTDPKPLGMKSGKISDNAITASSTHSVSYKPSFGRLTRVGGSGCSWTPTGAGRVGSWLQVDLGQLTTVTGIATQGTCYSSEWAKSYSVSYSNEPNSWTPYEESGNVKVSLRINLVWWNITKHGFRN